MSTKAITLAIRRAGTAKEVGRMTGSTSRAVEKWRSGEAFPSGRALLRLMAKSREVAQAVLEYTGLTNEWLDVEEMRLLAELTSIRAKRGLDGNSNSPGSLAGCANFAERVAEIALARSDKP